MPFDFHGQNVRSLLIDGAPWFVARDVCDCLELENITNALARALARLRDNEKLTLKVLNSGQHRDMWMVNEPGLYRLVFTSTKKEAQAFQDWVYGEVLPAIRQTGAYALPAAGLEARLTALEQRLLPVAAMPHPLLPLFAEGLSLREIAARSGKKYRTVAKAAQRLRKAGQLQWLGPGIYRPC